MSVQVDPEPGVWFRRELPDGRVLDMVPLTYGRARLHIGPAGCFGYDDGW